MISEATRFPTIIRSRWWLQMVTIGKMEWTLAHKNWQDTSWKSIVMLIVSILLLVLPISFILGGAIVALPSHLITHILPIAFTTAFLLLLSMQALQAPTKLWNMPDLHWYFIAPLPLPLLLIRPVLSLMKSILFPIVIILFCVSILMIFWHGSFALLLLLSIFSMYGTILCTFIALLGILVLTWLLGVKRAQIAVMGAAGIMSIPALVALFSLLSPKIMTIQGISLILHLQQPVSTFIEIVWKLLTEANALTSFEVVLLLIVLLLLPTALVTGYFWLGKRIYQRTWEGLQQGAGESTSSSLTTTSHPIWELVWHLPGISPSQAVLIGYCWQDGIRNWTDVPTIVVYFLISVMSQIAPLLNSGNIQAYRDFLPLIGILILLGENQFILLTIGKSLISRLIKADWLLKVTPVTARDIFNAASIAILLPIVISWVGIGFIICIALGIQPLSIMITMIMLVLGLAASIPVTLSTSIFSAHHGSRLSIMSLTWILSMTTVIGITMMTTLLIFPTLSASMQSNLGQLGNRVFHVTLPPLQQGILFFANIVVVTCIVVFTRSVGISRLRQDIEGI